MIGICKIICIVVIVCVRVCVNVFLTNIKLLKYENIGYEDSKGLREKLMHNTLTCMETVNSVNRISRRIQMVC